MLNATTQLTSWRDGAFVSPAVAAQILGYSLTHVRMLIATRALEAVRQAKNGPVFITVESLTRLIDEATPVTPREIEQLRRTWKVAGQSRPALSLIVNNTWK